MSYSEGEGVIDYSYSETDVFKTAKSNIRHFIEVIIGIAIGIGLLTILCSSLLGAVSCLGGCLGCEACIETAACADECGSDCLDCDFEGQTIQNVMEANERVSCEGVDCFGREGCFSCGGCGDCSSCKGVKYYTIKTNVNGEVHSKRMTDSDISEGSYFGTSSLMDSNYFSFLGYFDKAEGGTQYVDSSGYIVKSLKDNMTLYPQYREYGLGEVYEFKFDLSAAGDASEHRIALRVGETISGFPTAPEVEGYTFKGWYAYVGGSWSLMLGASEGNPNGKEFHLYNFHNIYNAYGKSFDVRPQYNANTYVITFDWAGTTYTEEAKHNDTFGSVASKMQSRIPSEKYKEIYGWGALRDSDPTDRLLDNTKITKSMTVYAIGKEYKFTFSVNTGDVSTQYKMTVRAGKPISGFPTAPEVEGYTFKGWQVYLGGSWLMMHEANDGDPNGREFHLYNFENLAGLNATSFEVRAEYTPNKYTITFNLEGRTYTQEASHNETFASVAAKMDGYIPSLDYGEFFGWGKNEDTRPENAIKGSTPIKESMTVYAIFHQAVYVRFYSNVNSSDSNYDEQRYYENQTNVVFPTFTDASLNPGHEFKGWYTSREPATNDQPIYGITLVDSSMTKTYYAKWEKATYTIEYRVMDYSTGYDYVHATESYQMSDEPIDLRSADEVLKNVGYDCTGWSKVSAESGETYTQLPAGTYGNTVLYARFVPHTYTFNMESAPGTTSDDPNWKRKEVAYGGNYTLAKPNRTGYDFLGWYYQKDESSERVYCTDPTGASLKPFTFANLGLTVLPEEESSFNRNLTLKAGWKRQTFDVIFMVEGDKHEQIEVEWNGYVDMNKIIEPKKDGHRFDGWTYDGNTLFNPTTKPITEDLTLYAKFSINTFTVRFMIETSEGGTPQEYPVNWVEWNTTLSVAVSRINNYPNDSALHRKLVGWYADSNYQTKLRDDKKLTEATTIYAKYDYADKFIFHGAKNGDEVWYYNGTKETFPEAADNWGYQFVGWCTDQECQTTPIQGSVSIYEGIVREYYPKYEAIEYTITYQYESGDFYRTDKYTIETVKVLLTKDDAPIKTGYTFIGWREKNVNGVLTGNLLTELRSTFGDKTLVAQYTANTYYVTLLNEGGNEVKPVVFDQSFKLGKPVDKEGYDFKGWSWTNDESGLATDGNGDSLAGVKYTNAYDSDMYPIYKYKTYTISWRDGGTGGLLFETKAEHFSKLNAENCSKDGYTFVGWYQDRDCTQEYVFNTNEVTGEETIYAKFTPINYSVSFVIGSGLEHNVTLPFGTPLGGAMAEAKLKVEAFEDQYRVRFVHWEQGTRTYDEDDTVPVGGLTLRAKFYWPITVQFYEGNTLVYQAEKLYYYNESIPEYTYEKAGYEFGGWYRNGSLTERVTFPVAAADSGYATTYAYFAKWIAKEYQISYHVAGADNISAISHTGKYTMDQTEISGGYTLWKPSETEQTKGYVFDGWYLNSNYSGEKISVIENWNTDELLYGDIELYAKWTRAQYTITLMKDDAVWRTITVEYGQTLETLPVLENMTGKLFNGWEISTTGVKVVDYEGNWESDYKTYVWTESIILVADWWDDV